jgi:tRNA guanosine-2'-O-methyltransferase
MRTRLHATYICLFLFSLFLFISFLSIQNLLRWLRDRKEEGYFIVGLEQTSSSVSLSEFKFPDRPTVLLLGKEKEGIPVEYLQVVDQCLEIPQFGIIRSLNVHVSGAIAIWEHTKQRMAEQKQTIG